MNTEQDYEKFVDIMNFLGTCFPERKITPAVIIAYNTVLLNFTIDTLRRAAVNYVRTGTRFPLVSELVSLCEKIASA